MFTCLLNTWKDLGTGFLEYTISVHTKLSVSGRLSIMTWRKRKMNDTNQEKKTLGDRFSDIKKGLTREHD